MGHLEEKSRKRTRNELISALILGSVWLAGGIAIVLIAPNVLGAMGKLGLTPKARQEEYVSVARRRLKKQGYLLEKDGHLHLTSKGVARLQFLALSLASIASKARWDEKWRVLIFDIPDKRSGVRARIREQLRMAGFKRLQHSVWINPYPCEEFVALLKTEFRVGKHLIYLIVDVLEYDSEWRSRFGLVTRPHDEPPPLQLPKALDAILEPILPKR
ncbi:MAG: hypothetical protein AAB605_03070 [Patescibacteria group bacterium]